MNARAVWRRFVTLLRRRSLERDLDDELAFHLAMREAEAAFGDPSPSLDRFYMAGQPGYI